jgi:hypothetical protein
MLGETIKLKNLDGLQRGDLLFWQGHVAIAQSADWMIHASGHHMEVVVEPIRRALERIGESHGPLLFVKRLPQEQIAPPQVLAANAATKGGPGDANKGQVEAIGRDKKPEAVPSQSGGEPQETGAQSQDGGPKNTPYVLEHAVRITETTPAADQAKSTVKSN